MVAISTVKHVNTGHQSLKLRI